MSPATSQAATPMASPSRGSLLFASEFLDDVEGVRIATENRLRSMKEDGFSPEPYLQQVEAFKAIEAEATKQLSKAMKSHPLGPFVERSKGIGLKQGARLIAAIGDPYIKPPMFDEDGNEISPARPRRGPAELWAYCGYHTLPAGDHRRGDTQAESVASGSNVAAKRRKGVKANWNSTAKMRAFLIAESCVKCLDSPYRRVYDDAKASWADRDVKDGHRHNHALRLTAKAILRDLYIEAKQLHGAAA